jgi:hypothetical protein
MQVAQEESSNDFCEHRNDESSGSIKSGEVVEQAAQRSAAQCQMRSAVAAVRQTAHETSGCLNLCWQ